MGIQDTPFLYFNDMTFVLFGHSFVRRLRNRCQFVLEIELERTNVPITCLGEGGLTLIRIR